jgi:methylisocitrate lyase
MTTLSTQLRDKFTSDEILVLPGAYDALAARLIEQAGFEAVFMSGFGIAASHLGVPDVGLLTGSQAIERAAAIAGTVDIPLLADMDTGYGSALNVTHTVRQCARQGIAGVILEDQDWPKRCGHMTGKTVIPAERHATHLRAAREAAPDIAIVARTDARAPLGLDEAVRRGHLYAECGIDVLFVEALETEEEMRRVASEFDIPLLANMVEGGKSPYLTPGQLHEMGFAAALYPVSALLAAAKAVQETLTRLRETGVAHTDRVMGFEKFQEVVGVHEWRALDELYGETAE